jgi:uncharacterized membrane protein
MQIWYKVSSLLSFVMLFEGYFILGNGIGSMAHRYMYIGETEVFNATHERWCLSKEFIRPGSNLYIGG